jgi:preprotein translocase subunit SecF
MFIIKNKKIFISISIFLVIASIAFLSIFGLQVGIDFKGGAMTEIAYQDSKPEKEEINSALMSLNLGTFLVQSTGDLGYIIKTKDLTEEEHSNILKVLSFEDKYKIEEKGFNSIGPSVGKELARKAIIAIILVSLGVILFIAFAFRKVSKPISSWKYGFIAVIALLHDVIIAAGIFAFIAHYLNIEIDTLFVVGILTILGLSVSDTIVIFDRIRENLRNQVNATKVNFGEIVGKSLSQSYVRSLSTSVTVILVLLSLFFFGPASTKYFALLLSFGMFFGTYSSIFLASPLLVLLEERKAGKK